MVLKYKTKQHPKKNFGQNLINENVIVVEMDLT
jgi:hypothetical protein